MMDTAFLLTVISVLFTISMALISFIGGMIFSRIGKLEQRDIAIDDKITKALLDIAAVKGMIQKRRSDDLP